MIKRIDRHARSHPGGPTPLPLELISVGRSFWTPGASYERVRASRFGLELIIRGGVDLIQNGRRFEAGPGDLFILHRGSHHTYASQPGYDWTLKRFVVLQGTGLDSLVKSLGLEGISAISLRHPARMEQLFRQLWTCCERDRQGEAHRASSILYSMLMETHQSLPTAGDGRLAPILRHLQLHLDKTLNRDDLARVAKMSYSHLNRLFKNEVGRSPMAHFEGLKMERARFYLMETTWSVQQVARQLGYEDPLYFSTRYRHYHGKSPRAQRLELGPSRVGQG